MSDSLSSRPSADRQLLFGILALQLDFISRDALIAAVRAWVLDKGKALGRILQDQGQLPSDRLVLLNALVAAHLKAHHNDPRQSLEAVAVASSVRQELESLRDGDLHEILKVVADLGATGPHASKPQDDGVVQRYRIIRPHAKGGLGPVYLAEDQELHRQVALKEIQYGLAQDPRCRRRFLLEAEITGGLEHPGIVPVYGLGQHADGRPFYAMRFVQGDTLEDAIQRFHQAENLGHPPEERRLALRRLLGRFVEVCNAIAYAHSRGVLHRDLKPGKILLGKYGETLVVGWGLAKPTGRREATTEEDQQTLRPSSASNVELTQIGAAIGTPAYMSPEQALGQLEQLGPASDVYSLGATLYTLLTGKPPVESKETGDLLRRVQEGRVLPPQQVNPTVPPELAAICLKAMARQPRARYDSALDLAADVEHWLADEPVTAAVEPVGARTRRWMRRHQAMVNSGVAALLVGVVFLGVLAALFRYQNAELAQGNAKELQAKEELAQKHEALAQANDKERRANAELDENNRALEQAIAKERVAREGVNEKNKTLTRAIATERTAREELDRKHQALARAHDKERRANAELHEKNIALAETIATERTAREELDRKHQALTQAHDKERRANAELHDRNKTLAETIATERTARAELDRKHQALARATDKERKANAELQEKNKALEQAIANERAANLVAKKELALANQAVADSRIYLAMSYNSLGTFADRSSKQEDGIAWYTKAIAVLEAVRQHEPNQAQASDLLGTAHTLRAFDLTRLNRHGEALRDWDRALELAHASAKDGIRQQRALALAHEGHHVQAVAEVHDLTERKEVNAARLYDLACVCALALAAAHQDTKLPQAQRDQLGEEYAVRAIELLAKAQTAGHFKDRTKVEHLKKDTDLDGLRGRDDFQELVDALDEAAHAGTE
jgi:hypothetical protein